jgi:hypothetical protein
MFEKRVAVLAVGTRMGRIIQLDRCDGLGCVGPANEKVNVLRANSVEMTLEFVNSRLDADEIGQPDLRGDKYTVTAKRFEKGAIKRAFGRGEERPCRHVGKRIGGRRWV